MKEKETTDTIIYKFLSGNADNKETDLLLEWLKEDRQNRIYYFTLKRIWLESREQYDRDKLIDDSWNRFNNRTSLVSAETDRKSNRRLINYSKIFVAATVFLLIGLTAILGLRIKDYENLDASVQVVSVPKGSRTSVTLPDGSQVWVNAGSTLEYRSDFAKGSRTVTIEGEAYFKVVPMKNSIFTVNTRDLVIKVHGTEFNVKSYPDEATSEATLISGKVEVLLIEDNGLLSEPVRLSLNQKLTYSRDKRDIEVISLKEKITEVNKTDSGISKLPPRPNVVISRVTNTETLTSWKDGRLTFNRETLEDLAPKLERFYNIEITFEENSVKSIRFTGTLENVTLEEAMKAIRSASGISYRINKNKVFIFK